MLIWVVTAAAAVVAQESLLCWPLSLSMFIFVECTRLDTNKCFKTELTQISKLQSGTIQLDYNDETLRLQAKPIKHIPATSIGSAFSVLPKATPQLKVEDTSLGIL